MSDLTLLDVVSPRLLGLLVVLWSGLVLPPGWAAPGPAALFSEHAVLQRGKPVPIWGESAPGEAIAVAYREVSARTVADASGRWRVVLPAMDAAGPATLTVRGTATVAIRDVAVGDVWLVAGQSNIEWPLAKTVGAAWRRDGAAVVEFEVSPGGLVMRAPAVSGPSWEVAGEDNRFVAAEGRLEGDRVVVAAAVAPQPRAVRYLAHNNPVLRLFSRKGLPVAPFQCVVSDRSQSTLDSGGVGLRVSCRASLRSPVFFLK